MSPRSGLRAAVLYPLMAGNGLLFLAPIPFSKEGGKRCGFCVGARSQWGWQGQGLRERLSSLDVAACQAALFQILLVVILCAPKLRGWSDFRDDPPFVRSRPLERFLRSAGRGFLLG